MHLTTNTQFACFPRTNCFDGTLVRSHHRCKIVYINNTKDNSDDRLPDNHVSIDDLVAEFEQGSGMAGMTEARRWAGENFFDNDKPSLRALRLVRGMSQKQLAEAIGSQQSYIARIENGDSKNIYLTTFQKLSEALDVDKNILCDALVK